MTARVMHLIPEEHGTVWKMDGIPIYFEPIAEVNPYGLPLPPEPYRYNGQTIVLDVQIDKQEV